MAMDRVREVAPGVFLANPMRHDLPCQWQDPVPVDRELRLGETVRWREHEVTTHELRGHTRYAAPLEVEVDGVRVLVTGDRHLAVPAGWSVELPTASAWVGVADVAEVTFVVRPAGGEHRRARCAEDVTIGDLALGQHAEALIDVRAPLDAAAPAESGALDQAGVGARGG